MSATVQTRTATYAPVAIWGLLLLCLPAILRWSPIVYPDTRGYYLGGKAAVEKALSVAQGAFGTGAALSTDDVLRSALTVRSAYYSVFTYILTTIGGLTLVAVVQAMLIGTVLFAATAYLRPENPVDRYQKVLLYLTLTTSLPWVTSYAMPDIFTPIMFLSIALLAVYWDKASPLTRLCLLTTICASIVMHVFNLPLAIIAVLISFVVRSAMRRRPTAIASMIGAIALAVIAMLAVGVAGFGQWTISPHSAPFALARSLDDGPGKLYLRDHCPQVNLAMCNYLDRMDVGADDFIWHDNGVYAVAPPDVQERLRNESNRIFIAAALEHPLMQLTATAKNLLVQLSWFTLRDYHLYYYGVVTPNDFGFREGGPDPLWMQVLSAVVYINVIGSIVVLTVLWRRSKLSSNQKAFVVIIALCVVANAGAGALSLPAPRYGARAMWLLPYLAACLLPSFLKRGATR